MEYLDLSPYSYGNFPLPMKAIGWLGLRYGVQGGTASPLENVELQQLRAASGRLGSKALGWHLCDFCDAFEGNGEYRYYLRDGQVLAAPMMILHYAEEHGYRPPQQLMLGLPETGAPLWDWRAERLRAVLLDESEHIDRRAQAAVDLALWNDRRAFDALVQVAHHGELADCGGDEVGRSLAVFLGRGYADRFAGEQVHAMVRYGLDQGLRH